ncbi:MAG TPA: NAD(P)H-dependent glycerol-3-phosphate dehydrogenase [Casimicrobiaceae bacterium]|nr:NAD(P)H-dependent glycerol-3-phosphate dehydrogenase [Casimicrobiaceae bacterium]
MTPPPPRANVAVVGAGAWGTAIACHLAARAHAAPRVVLVGRSRADIGAMRRARRNERYLPGVALPEARMLADELAAASDAEVVFTATPIGALETVVEALAAARVHAPLVWLSKGFVAADGTSEAALAHRRIAPRWRAPVGVVSGPSFAGEVARGLPTALVSAATEPSLASRAAALLRGDTLRVYETDDLIGVEVAGAVKNVLAIAAGLSDGLGYGHNARAALITRGLAEISRLAVAEGGRRDTLMGLAGLGDLVLTCTGDASRNRQVGLALAQGRRLADILAALGHVAEGVYAARAACALARRHGVDMPITAAIAAVLDGELPVRDAVEALLRREPKADER